MHAALASVFRSFCKKTWSIGVLLFVFAHTVLAQVPSITGFSPNAGAPGTTVTITGTGFNTTAANNAVFFNGARGTVTAATATQLTVTVPHGGRSGFIDVVNLGSFRQGKAKSQFIMAFNGLGFTASSMAAPVNFSTGTTSNAPRQLDLADMDGDGKLDIVVNRNATNIGILRNTTTGATPTFATLSGWSNINSGQAFAIADLNSDGKLDIFQTSQVVANAQLGSVAPNNSTVGNIVAGGAVGAGGTGAANQNMRGAAVADISSPADGRPDAVWVFETSGGINNSLLQTNVNSGASPALSFAGNVGLISSGGFYRMWNAVAADFDGDGLNDVATYETNTPAPRLLVSRNTSTSGFTNTYYTLALGTASPQAGRMLVYDVDRDGKPDLLLFVGSSQCRVYRNTSVSGTLSFVFAGDFGGTVADRGYFTMGDVTGDGFLDLIFACNNTTGSVTVLPNTTSGGTISFGTPIGFAGQAASDVAVGDINADGKPDIVSISAVNATANVYINNVQVLQPPTITSFTPNNGGAGATITITGTNFTGATAVTFGANNTPAQSFTVVSATQISATVAAGTNDGPIRVTTQGGTATSATNFTFRLPPVITSFTPASGPVGTVITITGSLFSASATVTIGANNTPATNVSSSGPTSITATVAAGTVSGPVRVTTAGGTATSTTDFTVAGAAPTISNTNPTSGAPGTVVTITGTNFTGATAVTFGAGNTNAASFTVNSATQITATIGAGSTPGPGPVRVTTPAGTANLNGFVVTSNIPAVNNIVGPISGVLNWIVTGGMLTINGTNFTGTTAVTIGTGNTPVTNFTVVSATQITCRVAAATTVGSGPIRITNASGTGVSANYTIVSGLPVINSFTPASGSAGTTVVINGGNLYIDNGSPNPTVTIGANNTPATVLGYSGNDLSVSVGAGTTTGPITITTTYGSVTSSTNFTAAAPVPTITALNGNSGPAGSAFVIEGTNFNGATAVTINNVAVASFTVFSNTQILANIAGNNTTGLVRVITPAGTAVSATPFTVTPPPAPSNISFTPTSGPVGTTVTISGGSLITATAVTIGGNNTPPQSWSVNAQQQITAVVAPGTTSGPIRVTNPSGTAVSSTNFTVIGTGPTVTSISPLSAPAGATITVQGNNLTGAQVSVASRAFTVLSNNGTTMTVQVPTNAVSGVVQISTSGGSAPATGFFTFQTNNAVLQHRAGQLLTLTGPAGASSYQWQVDQGSGFVNLTNAGVYSGVNTQILTINNIATSATGYRYRVVTNGSNTQPALVLRFVTHARANGAFSNTATWEGGLVPDLNTDVIINDVNLQMDVNSTVRTLTVVAGANVQVQPGVRLTIRQ